MKIELLNIELSIGEETNAFSGKLMINDEFIAEVSNSGRGESNLYRYKSVAVGMAAHKAADHYLLNKYQPISMPEPYTPIPYKLDEYVDYLVERTMYLHALWEKINDKKNSVVIFHADGSHIEMKFGSAVAKLMQTRTGLQIWKTESAKHLKANSVVACPWAADLPVTSGVKKAVSLQQFLNLAPVNGNSEFTPIPR